MCERSTTASTEENALKVAGHPGVRERACDYAEEEDEGEESVSGARLRLATRGDDAAHYRSDEIEAALGWLLDSEPEEHEARHQPEAPDPMTPDRYHFVSGLHVAKSTSVGR